MYLLHVYIPSPTHTQIRRVVSDFGVFIAVGVWVGVDFLADVDTPKLEVPNVFGEHFFTSPNRTRLFISPLGTVCVCSGIMLGLAVGGCIR